MPPPSDSGSILPPAYAPLREVIGDFEIVAKIGQGGMGSVYRARQVSLDRLIALKLLPAQMVGDEDAVARFRREARVASSLSHANLVAVYAAGEADGCHFIAMELIEGEDLGRRLKRDGKPTVPEALRICAEVTRGLDHGWRSAQLIHRDIKPANIFLAADGAVKLGDLGLAKTLGSLTTGLTQSGTMLGTPHYMSPEQARGDREIDFRADIYSLGCTLYQMLTGQVPYRGGDAITIIRQHLDAPLPAIMKVWPQCPVPLARLVGRMLKKSRHERPASYAELLGQIDSVWAQIDPVGHSPEAFAPPPRPAEPEMTAPLVATPPHPPPRSKGLLYGGIAAGVLALAAVAFIVWPKKEPLTKAEIMAAQRAAEASARAHDPARAAQTSEDGGDGKAGGDKAAPSAADKLPVPKAAAPESAAGTHPQPRVWIDDTEKIRSGLKDGSVVADGEWLVATKNFFTNLGGERSSHDSAVRVVFSNRIMVILRQSAKQYVAEGGKHASIYLYDPATHKTMGLGEVEMGTAYVPDATHELVFAAQGDQLSLWLDGREVAHVSDATLTAGKMALGLMTGAEPAPRIKKVEYGDLETAGTGQIAVSPSSGKPAISIAELLTSPDYEWSKPENLGPNVNSPQDEYRLALSDDGLILVFNSSRAAKAGLYESRRPSVDEPFGPAVPIEALNSVGDNCGGPSLSGDGLTLLYHSRAGPNQRGGCDIYQSRRRTRSSPWEPPVNLGPPVNTTGGYEIDPCLSPDGLTLLFSSPSRPGGAGVEDLWRARRKSPDAPFENPENLGRGVNSELREYEPRFTADQRTILFCREDPRENYKTPAKIHVAVEADSGQWTARPLDLPASGGVKSPALSPDGHTLYFYSYHPGGQGGSDFWQIRRVPKAGPATSTAAWKPVVLTRDWVAKQRGASLSASGELTTTQYLQLTLPGIFGRDIAIRGEMRQPPKNMNSSIHLRHVDGLESRYLIIYPHDARLQLRLPQFKEMKEQYPSLSEIHFPPEMEIADKWVPFEFATVGRLSFATVQSLAFPATASEKAVQPEACMWTDAWTSASSKS